MTEIAVWPIRGGSMLPTLVDGQRVLIRLGRRLQERGDLLLFRQVDYLVVHRLLGWTISPEGDPCLRTRGDGSQLFDPPLDGGNVEGSVIAIEEDGSWWELRGAGARFYALLVAIHDLLWALAGMLAKKADGALQLIAIGAPLQSWVWSLDRYLLGLIHRVLFKRLHARSASPPECGCYTADSPD